MWTLIFIGVALLVLVTGLAFAAFWIDGGRPVLPAADTENRPTVIVQEVTSADPTH